MTFAVFPSSVVFKVSRSSLLQKRLYVCVCCLCVGVICLLLLMSRDLPLLTTLQNVSVLVGEIPSVVSSLRLHM